MPRPSSRSRSRKINKPVLTLYSRLYCHLCEEMLAALQALRGEHNFILEVIDIDMSDELRERYGTHVPVLEAEGREICRYFFDANKLVSALRLRHY